jgi:hypothetical protein
MIISEDDSGLKYGGFSNVEMSAKISEVKKCCNSETFFIK